MPRKPPSLKTPRCQVCRHPEHNRIGALRAGGASYYALEEQFGLHWQAIRRHWDAHVSNEAKTSYLAGPATIEALRKRSADENASYLDYLNIMRSLLMAQMVTNSEAKSSLAVAMCSARLLDVLREIAKLNGEVMRLNPSITINNTVNITDSPIFVNLQAGLVQVAAKHPEARADLIALMHDLKQRQADAPAIEASANAA